MARELDLKRFADAGYRWNDNILPDMTHEEQNTHLLSSAEKAMSHSEWAVAYQILRELVWRDPRWKPEPWNLLSTSAEALGKIDEAKTARMNYSILSKHK